MNTVSNVYLRIQQSKDALACKNRKSSSVSSVENLRGVEEQYLPFDNKFTHLFFKKGGSVKKITSEFEEDFKNLKRNQEKFIHKKSSVDNTNDPHLVSAKDENSLPDNILNFLNSPYLKFKEPEDDLDLKLDNSVLKKLNLSKVEENPSMSKFDLYTPMDNGDKLSSREISTSPSFIHENQTPESTGFMSYLQKFKISPKYRFENNQQHYSYSHNTSPQNIYNIQASNYFSNSMAMNQTSVDINPAFHNEINYRPLKVAKIVAPIQNYTELDDEELSNNAFALAKDQAGCRYLQGKVEKCEKFANNFVFPKILENLIELMNDSFGNYLIQKLLDQIHEAHLKTLMDMISPHILGLGCNPHGTRCLQKLIENLKTTQLIEHFIKIFKSHFLDLFIDVNGNHIIQKFVLTIPEKHKQFLYELIFQNLYKLCTDKHGCCVMQKCIEVANKEITEILINKLVENGRFLMADQYGNYVLQYVIGLNDFKFNKTITDFFINDIFDLSTQKFCSNVIEKCFSHCDETTLKALVDSLAIPERIPELLTNMYGNYVLQKALSVSDEVNYLIFIDAIKPALKDLKTVSFGSKLYSKLLKLYPDLNQSSPLNNLQTKNKVTRSDAQFKKGINQYKNYSKTNKKFGTKFYKVKNI